MTEFDSTAKTPTDGPVADAVSLDPRSLRGLAHPMRIKLLGLLRERGPATATGLALVVDESSGTTSYHLRQLAAHGFIVEDENPHDSKRERWWRAAHRMTTLDPWPTIDPETSIVVDEYLRAIAMGNAERIVRFADDLSVMRQVLGPSWATGNDLSDWFLELNADEAAELIGRLTEVVRSYRIADPERAPAPGAQRVIVQMQVMPLAVVDERP